MLAYTPAGLGTLVWNAGGASAIQNDTSQGSIAAGFAFNQRDPQATQASSGDYADIIWWTNTDLVQHCTGVGTVASGPASACTEAYSGPGSCVAPATGQVSCAIADADLNHFIAPSGTPGFGSNGVPVNPTSAIAIYGTPALLLQGPVLSGNGVSGPLINVTTGTVNNAGTATGGAGFQVVNGIFQYYDNTATTSIGSIAAGGATQSAGTCQVVYSSGAPTLTVGEPFIVDYVIPSAFNGSWTVSAINNTTHTVSYSCPATTNSVAISAATWVANQTTITVPTSAGFHNANGGQTVALSGFTTSGASLNGNFAVASVPNSTHVILTGPGSTIGTVSVLGSVTQTSGRMIPMHGQVNGVVTAGSETGSGPYTATLTYSQGQPLLLAGQQILVEGVTPSGYNGVQTVTSASTGSVSYALASNPGSYTSGGLVGPMNIFDVSAGPSGAPSATTSYKWMCASDAGDAGYLPYAGSPTITSSTWTAQPAWPAGGQTVLSAASMVTTNLIPGEWITLSGFSGSGASLNGTFYITAVSAGVSVTIAGPATTTSQTGGTIGALAGYQMSADTCDLANPSRTVVSNIASGDLLAVVYAIRSNAGPGGTTNTCAQIGPNSGKFTTATVTQYPSIGSAQYNSTGGNFFLMCGYSWIANGTEQPPFQTSLGWTTASAAQSSFMIVDFGQSQVDASATGGGMSTVVGTAFNAPGITSPGGNADYIAGFFSAFQAFDNPFTCPPILNGGANPMTRRADISYAIPSSQRPEILFCDGVLPANTASANPIIGAARGNHVTMGLSIPIKHN